MIRPKPARRMCGTAARQARKVAWMFMPKIACHRSSRRSSMSHIASLPLPPAALTRASSVLKRDNAASTTGHTNPEV